MFIESFEKTADLKSFAKRLVKSKPAVGAGLTKSREQQIRTGAGRTYEKLKGQGKIFNENVGGVSQGSVLSGEAKKMEKHAPEEIRSRARKVFGGEGKPTLLGRAVARHPIAAGVATYAASKAAFGDRKKEDQGPAVTYPATQGF